MTYYPVYLSLQGKKVLLIGGGNIALQKIPALLEAEASILLVSPEVLPDVAAFAQAGRLRWEKRGYATQDLDGAALVIAATDDENLQQRVASESRARGIWVNIVDVPPLCDFIAPAIVRRGAIQIAISTGGASPALAKLLRQKLEPLVGPEYAELAAMAQRARPRVLEWPRDKRLSFWNRVVSEPFLEMIRRDGAARAEQQLQEWLNGNAAL